MEVSKNFVDKVVETLENITLPSETEGGPIDELITKLKSSNYIERANSARRLCEAGVKISISALLPLLNDPNDYVRVHKRNG